MASATTRGGPGRLRSLPLIYVAGALLIAAALLPTILRPPPEQTSDTASLSPDAPPDEQSEQVIQALQQASGGGAGAASGGSTTVPGGSAPPEATTTASIPRPPASGRCFGDPARQIESVYSAPCAPAFAGSNGGSTSKNVFPNEVRLGFWHVFGTPNEGVVREEAQPGESGETRTFRVLQAYMNKRYQTWGRKVSFYGLRGGGTPDEQAAEVTKAVDQQRLFGAYHLDLPFCSGFARKKVGPLICNPLPAETYTSHRPTLFSFMTEIDQALGYGAEYSCKRLVGKPAAHAVSENLKGKTRSLAFVTENGPVAGVPKSRFDPKLRKECGASVGDQSYELSSTSDPSGSSATATQLNAAKVTTVILYTTAVNAVYIMSTAQSIGYEPEWVLFTNYGLDFNAVGRILPQAKSTFGFSAWEVPRPFRETECYQAYKSVAPDTEPNGASCGNHWHPMLMLMNGIQEAGPNLTPETFEKALFKLGRRYPAEPWAIGGGFAPGDYSYMDNVSEIWWDPDAAAPQDNALGAYRWTFGARRFKRGELPLDGSQLFTKGVTSPGRPEQ